MQRMKVVFPDPDGPTITRTSPRRTVSDTPCSTCWSPNHFWTCSASTTTLLTSPGVMPIDARMSEPCFILTGPLCPYGLQSSRQRIVGSRCLSILPQVSEAPLYGILNKSPGRREGQIVESNHGIKLENAKCCRGDHLGCHQKLRDADDAHQCRVLQHRVELVAERRENDPDRLWQNDPPHRFEVCHAERLRRLDLPGVDGQYPGPDDFG